MPDSLVPGWVEDGAPRPLYGLAARLMPQNIQAEQSLLGALLANNKALDRCEDLQPEHFADPVHGRIFAVIRSRVSRSLVADAVTLRGELENSGVLEEVGGVAYLAQLLSSLVAIINAGDYAREIFQCWKRRELIEIGEVVVNGAFGGALVNGDADSVITAAVDQLLSLSEKSGGARTVSHSTALDSVLVQAEAAQNPAARLNRLNTGVGGMDTIWRGLYPGELYYLLARSGTGKTPAMMQIARNVAGQLLEREQTGCVHVFSLEMTADSIARLGLAATTRWNADELKDGSIKFGDFPELMRARDALARLPIEIDDEPELDMATLATRARVMKRKRNTGLVCIDFRELIRRPKEHARMQLPEWIPFVGYQLKALAKTLNVPIIALTQVNKDVDRRDDTRPQKGDIPYCGGVAADASFALHRPELLMGDEPPPITRTTTKEKEAEANAAWWAKRDAARGVAEFIALRRRSGPLGFTRLRFDGPRQLLRDIDVRPSSQPDMLEPPPVMSEADYGG
jgi:replicative DNA helicase